MAEFTKNTTNRFKDEKGRWLSMSLFFECHKNNEDYPSIYTLKDEDHNEYISIKKLYLAFEDPTEYLIATEYFGGWEHWKYLCSTNWFRPHINEWRDELEVKMKCKALRELISDNNKNFITQKFIINKEWEVKRGRPSKADLEKQSKINSRVNDDLENDYIKLIKLNEK